MFLIKSRELWERWATQGQVSNAARRSRNSNKTLQPNTIMAFLCESYLNFFTFNRPAGPFPLGILQYIDYRIGCIVVLQHQWQQSSK